MDEEGPRWSLTLDGEGFGGGVLGFRRTGWQPQGRLTHIQLIVVLSCCGPHIASLLQLVLVPPLHGACSAKALKGGSLMPALDSVST